jgi:predicted secreted protein
VKKILSLVVALGVATLFSSAALAGADCSPTHKTQAAVDRSDAKDVATAQSGEKADQKQVQTAEVTAPAKPAPEKK